MCALVDRSYAPGTRLLILHGWPCAFTIGWLTSHGWQQGGHEMMECIKPASQEGKLEKICAVARPTRSNDLTLYAAAAACCYIYVRLPFRCAYGFTVGFPLSIVMPICLGL